MKTELIQPRAEITITLWDRKVTLVAYRARLQTSRGRFLGWDPVVRVNTRIGENFDLACAKMGGGEEWDTEKLQSQLRDLQFDFPTWVQAAFVVARSL